MQITQRNGTQKTLMINCVQEKVVITTFSISI